MMKLGMRAKMDQAERLVQAASALCGYPEAEEWEVLQRCLKQEGYRWEAAVRQFVMVHIGDLAPLEDMSLRGWDRCRELLRTRDGRRAEECRPMAGATGNCRSMIGATGESHQTLREAETA